MFFMFLNTVSPYSGTSLASEPLKTSISIFCRSHMSDLGEYSACRLSFDLFGLFSMFFMFLDTVSLYSGTSLASEPLNTSISIFCRSHMSDLGEYSACRLLFDLFSLFSMFFCFLILSLCIQALLWLQSL